MDTRISTDELNAVIENIDEPITEDVPENTEVVEETPPETQEEERELPNNTVDNKEVEDLKEKLAGSTRESQTLYFKNKKISETIEQAANMADPTEEEIKIYALKQGANYDDLSEFERTLLRTTLRNERKFELIHQSQQDAKRVDEWANKVDSFIDDERNIATFPTLEDNKDAFRRFAMKETRRGMDFNDLLASFLYNNKSVVQKNKGSLLNSRGNGSLTPEKPNQLDENDAARIRARSPKEYNRLVREGKIVIDV
jgi:regulator of replication initiation timing